jgi:hypothetical protein
VLIGPEGAGKSIVGKILCRLFGQHGFVVSHAKHITGNFNAHLRDTVILLGDEAFYAGDKAHASILRSLITEPYLPVEAKYRDTINAPNFLHIILTANLGWVIPASIDARRFFVLYVSDEHVRNFAYFDAIFKEMENGGYEAMLHDLLHHDIRTFNVRDVPETEGLKEQKKLSLPTELAWWMEVLHRAYVWPSKHGLEAYFSEWHEVTTTELLYASYREFAKARGERHPMSRESLGRFMRKVGGKPCRPDKGVVGEHMADVKDSQSGHVRREAELVEQDRPPCFKFGALQTAREAFDVHSKLTVEWEPEPVEMEEPS